MYTLQLRSTKYEQDKITLDMGSRIRTFYTCRLNRGCSSKFPEVYSDPQAYEISREIELTNQTRTLVRILIMNPFAPIVGENDIYLVTKTIVLV